MTPEQMSEAFERVLADLGLDPATCRQGDGWWRFYPDDLPFQGGIHTRDFRISCSLGEIDSDADLDAVYRDIDARNAELTDVARFVERDNYLWVAAAAPFHVLDPQLMRAMVDACIALARTDAAATLRARYRQW